MRDKNDVVLGTGSAQVNITISQQTLNDSKKKAEEAKKDQEDKEEAQKKLNQALEALREGKIDEAIRLAEEAAKIDKKARRACVERDRTGMQEAWLGCDI